MPRLFSKNRVQILKVVPNEKHEVIKIVLLHECDSLNNNDPTNSLRIGSQLKYALKDQYFFFLA